MMTEEIQGIKEMLKSKDFIELAFQLAESQNLDIVEIVNSVYPVQFLQRYTSILIDCENYLQIVKVLLDVERLYLYHKQLTSIPKEIGSLTSLKDLDLQHNQLTSIPKEIGNLENLQYLRLHNNQLTSIPKEIGNLEKLEYLDIERNQLTSIPKEIDSLKWLKHFYTDKNKL